MYFTIDISSITDKNVAAKESAVAKPQTLCNKPSAGEVMARFMHEKFHKSTNAIDISNKDNAFTDSRSTAETPKILKDSPANQWAGTKRHTTPSIYTKGESYPHPSRLYTQVPQSKKLRWGVEESFHTSIFFVVREGFLSKSGLQTLGLVSSRFREMSRDVPRLLSVDFSSLTQTRLGYESQEEIDNNRVEKLSAAAVYYGLDLGLVTRYLGQEFTGLWRDTDAILSRVSPLVSKSDADHIKRILTDGCPAEFDFKEPHDNKMLLLERGNEPSIDMHIGAVNEMLNEEERNNHVIPFFGWLVFFSAVAHHVPQSMLSKPGSE